MERGLIVVAAAPGDYGKPRPMLVVQSGLSEESASVIVCPITSELRDVPHLRLTLEPSPLNGLQVRSQVMLDKITTLHTRRIGRAIGRADAEELADATRILAVLLGIA